MNSILLLSLSILIFIGLIVLIMKGILKWYRNSSHKIESVCAGIGNEDDCYPSKVAYLRPFEVFKYKGKRINPADYTVARVEGSCMKHRQIRSGSLVFIKTLNTNYESLKAQDILFINHTDNNNNKGYFLRELISTDIDNKVVKTRFYIPERSEYKEVSYPLSNIEGVVKFCFD